MELVYTVCVVVGVVGIVAVVVLVCRAGHSFRGKGPGGWKIETKPPKK